MSIVRPVRVMLNGEARVLRDDLSVADLVRELGLNERRIAVEINREILPRDAYPQRALCEDDVVEVVHFIGGG